MNPVKVRNIEIGAGIPKICVPIVATTREEIIEEAKSFKDIPVDVVEWRADWYEETFDVVSFKDTLQELREVLGETPLLMTIRTANEGGQMELCKYGYSNLVIAAIKSGFCDMVDLEIFTADSNVQKVIDAAKEYGVKVVASNHDFDKTPEKDEIVRRLCLMQAIGADIAKIAVMPTCKKDVLTLLEATEEMTRLHPETPIITMSMSATGVISRIAGEVFGSALTFGAAKKASAPGQMGVNDLDTVLKLLHNAL